MGPSADSSMDAALDKGAGGHDDLGVVAGHGPGLGRHIAVHRRGRLDALAEGHHGLSGVPSVHGLDDVVAVLGAAGHDPEAQASHRRSAAKTAPLSAPATTVGARKKPW